MGVSSLSAPSTRIASAGQAQAHSSQPTHFSRPSGWRLSWWRPWKRGAVGRGFSGYSSVATLRNIVENETPKPATGARSSARNPFSRSSPDRAPSWAGLPTASSAMGLLLGGSRGGRAARRGQHRLGAEAVARLDEALARQRRDGVATGERVDLLRRALLLGGDAGGTLVVPDPRRGEGDDGDDADDDDGRDGQLAAGDGQIAVTEEVQLGAADEGDGDDPGERDRDEELPAEAHELVVPDAGQRAAQPDEDEHEQPQLDREPQQSPPAAGQR